MKTFIVSFLFRHIFKPDAVARPDALPCALYSTQEPRIILQTVIKPIILRLKADQYSRRPAVAGDHDLLFFCQSQEFRKVVFHCR